MSGIFEAVILGVNWAILLYFLAINGTYFSLLFLSGFFVLKYRRRVQHERWRLILQSPLTVPVSVIAPAYNEELTIEESVKSLLMLQYPEYEVIVVNDGSKDDTLERLKGTFDLHQVQPDIEVTVPCNEILGVYRSPTHPNLVAVDKENGGKADALNELG